MRHIIICYDLKTPGKDYRSLINMIETIGSGTWAHLQDSVWYIKTTFTASEIVKRLRPCIDTNDNLFAVEIASFDAVNLGAKFITHLRRMGLL